MNTFNVSQSVGDIVAIMPKASEIFKAYKIDFCCGGNRSLDSIIKEQKLSEEDILSKLEAAYEETQKVTNNQVDLRKITPSELIDYIINTHHTYLKKSLPELSELTTMILRVHGVKHTDLFTVHKLYHSLKTDLDQHLIKEEEILFPMIKEYDKHPSNELFDKIRKVMTETEDEHDIAGSVIKELRVLTDQYKLPEDVCTTFGLTYFKLQELESDLFEHIHLENNILFKNFVE
ncbi:MAG: iron-sulfur cluster repair di-iron protein [Firmicutes bacterium HGW-Firmicutes-1]|jgi:regulator of cell morphogenesis and NO signaling|nr:MAG: iron-sulfur cluster repair di-iron protein [Firmicutes bacterium HGW-Firmicutes-1]